MCFVSSDPGGADKGEWCVVSSYVNNLPSAVCCLVILYR